VASLLVRIAMLEEQGSELENKLLHSEKDLESTKALHEQQRAFNEGREADASARESELQAKLKRVEKEAEDRIMAARAEATAQVERVSQQAAEAESNLQELSETSSSEHERTQSLLVVANDRADRLNTQITELSLEKEALQRTLDEAVSGSEERLREAEDQRAAAIGELETKLTELGYSPLTP
jgi:chromosome segregation ATPase